MGALLYCPHNLGRFIQSDWGGGWNIGWIRDCVGDIVQNVLEALGLLQHSHGGGVGSGVDAGIEIFIIVLAGREGQDRIIQGELSIDALLVSPGVQFHPFSVQIDGIESVDAVTQGIILRQGNPLKEEACGDSLRPEQGCEKIGFGVTDPGFVFQHLRSPGCYDVGIAVEGVGDLIPHKFIGGPGLLHRVHARMKQGSGTGFDPRVVKINIFVRR